MSGRRAAGWARDFDARAAAARRQMELQRSRREVRGLRAELAGVRADQAGAEIYTGEAVDLGEGTGVDAREYIRVLSQKAREEERVREERKAERVVEAVHLAAQRRARALADGSVVEERSGTRIVRARTEQAVPPRGAVAGPPRRGVKEWIKEIVRLIDQGS